MAATALLAIWVLLVLCTLGVHARYVAALRNEHPAVYSAIGEPPLVAYLGMFALGDNRAYWRHLIVGSRAESLRAGLQQWRRLLAVLLLSQIPVLAALMISLAFA